MTDIIYRPATHADIDTFYALYRDENIESYGNFGMSKQELLAEWDFPHFDLSEHTLYAFTLSGEAIAYAELRVWRDIPVRPFIYAYVRPDYRGQGIGTHLTRWGIETAQQFIAQVPDHARVVLGAFTNLEDGCELLDLLGFVNTRQSYVMSMKLNGDTPETTFPQGFRVLTMAEHPVLEDFVRVYQETFRDHRGAVDEPLQAAVKRWQSLINESYPPENFVLVREGERDAAVLIACDKADNDADQMFVQTLGTMPAYRKRGLATNLLYYAQALAKQKGKHSLGLSVDASSLTGAQRLYQQVGFGVDMVYHAYELEIRAGVELTRQS
ncbi:MAG: GNAT family N-acetyltransferase [Anaerolineae bacterium]